MRTTEPRAMPPHVTPAPDRHGKMRYRYRRAGVRGGYLPGEPWSVEWLTKLAEFQGQVAVAAPIESPTKVRPRSMDDLARRLRQSPSWARQSERTAYVQGLVLDRLLDLTNKRGQRFGDRLVVDITTLSLDRIFGDMRDRPGAANHLRKVLIRLFRYAAKIGWRTDNPAQLTEHYASGEGFRTWSEDDIAQYRAHHPLGTMARLVMELALNSAARRGNVATLEHSQIRNGRIIIAHSKGGNETSVPLMPDARAAIDAMPTRHITHVIHTALGKPFSVAGLGNKMRDWCNAAGLTNCSMHGLRKAQSRRLAEAGSSDSQGRSVTGHKKDATFAYYAAAAGREQMADAAMSNLIQHQSVQPEKP